MSKIDRFSGRYHFLSNFHPCTIEFDGATYPSVEHAYQAAKTLDVSDREVIRTCGNAGMAKKLGRHLTVRADWEKIKISVMTELVYAKFTNHNDLAQHLIATYDSVLEEGNWWNDRFWGVCQGIGENHLGKILMAVRDAIMEDHK